MLVGDNLRATNFPLVTTPQIRRLSIQALLVTLFFVLSGWPARGQELREQPTPFSVWLDFQKLTKSKPRKTGLPIWVESIERMAVVGDRALVRIRLRRMGALTDELQFRLFFVDKPGAAPVITGWTETGSQPYSSPSLGDGLGVETSESLVIPETDLDFLDRYATSQGIDSRSAVIQRAIRLLRASELGEAYTAAWNEWAESEDGALWDALADESMEDG